MENWTTRLNFPEGPVGFSARQATVQALQPMHFRVSTTINQLGI
jgi:hypothetical protein